MFGERKRKAKKREKKKIIKRVRIRDELLRRGEKKKHGEKPPEIDERGQGLSLCISGTHQGLWHHTYEDLPGPTLASEYFLQEGIRGYDKNLRILPTG